VTELPAIYLLYDSPFWSGAFLLGIFSVSVWNGGGFYIEVFGRKFERELEALRKELADATGRSGRSSPTSLEALNGGSTDEDLSTQSSSPLIMNNGLPPLATNDDVPPLVAHKKTE